MIFVACMIKLIKLPSVLLPSVLWRCWLGGRKGIRPVKKTEWWGVGMVICLEQGADLHMAQLMPLPLTVSCFSKIQIGFAFLVPAHPGSPGQRAVKRVCVWLSWVLCFLDCIDFVNTCFIGFIFILLYNINILKLKSVCCQMPSRGCALEKSHYGYKILPSWFTAVVADVYPCLVRSHNSDACHQR